jgi:hypothetical protein
MIRVNTLYNSGTPQKCGCPMSGFAIAGMTLPALNLSVGAAVIPDELHLNRCV